MSLLQQIKVDLPILEAVLLQELFCGSAHAREPSSGVSASLPSQSGDRGAHCSHTAARTELLAGDTAGTE